MDIPIPGLHATDQQRPSISSDSEAELTPASPMTRRRLLAELASLQQNRLVGPLPVSRLEYTGGFLFSGHEVPDVAVSNSGHSLMVQNGREEAGSTATANQSMYEGLQVENTPHGAIMKRYTVLRSCPNGQLVIVNGCTGNVVCTHKLHARLYPDVAIKAVGLAVEDSGVNSCVILVAQLLDGFGAEFVEVISVDTEDWNTEILFCGELIESNGSHDAGHIHILRHAQIALLVSHRCLVLVDWARKRISPPKSFIKAKLLRTHLVLEERQEHDSKVKGAVPSRSVIVSLADVWKEVASRAFANQVLLLDNIPNAGLLTQEGE
ncbi:hypothetical protein DFH11DRAFT_1882299 [Phellopilus nigrolimitatus]|nr:hypothetical protein DFH11DRAFT_1882299 [Phellopilus nigrolimitatus]